MSRYKYRCYISPINCIHKEEIIANNTEEAEYLAIQKLASKLIANSAKQWRDFNIGCHKVNDEKPWWKKKDVWEKL